MNMRKVTKEEFFAALTSETRDVISSVMDGPFPYTSVFRTRYGETLFGKIVDFYPEGKVLFETDYYLESKEQQNG